MIGDGRSEGVVHLSVSQIALGYNQGELTASCLLFDPLRRLKFLPWGILLQVGGITILLLVVIDWLLSQLYRQSSAIQEMIRLLLTPPLNVVVPLLIMMGIGALAVYVLERMYPQVIISIAVLWALVPCVALFLLLWHLLPIPAFLLGQSAIEIIAIALGIFFQGRPYWR